MYVTARAFNAIQNLNIGVLIDKDIDPPFTEKEIRPFLSSFVRSSILDSANFDKTCERFDRKQILLILVESEIVNNIVALLQVNYNELEVDIKKEQQLR